MSGYILVSNREEQNSQIIISLFTGELSSHIILSYVSENKPPQTHVLSLHVIYQKVVKEN